MPHISVNDCSLYYHSYGQGEPLVLISGYLCDHVYWRGVVSTLSRHYQVILLDNRGIGQSTVGEGVHSTEQMAQDTLALLSALHLDKASIVGHSMGGMIAHHMALLAPDKIKHLVLYGSRPYITALSAYYMKTFLELKQHSDDPVLHTRLNLPWVMSDQFFENPSRVEQLLQLAAQNPHPTPLEVQRQHYQALAQHDLRTRLSDISVPTTLLMGGADLVVPPALSLAMAKQIPMARYRLIDDASHSWHIEQPETFSKTLLAILSEVL